MALACPDALTRTELRRDYKDVDFAASRRRSRQVAGLLTTEGYVADREFNALHGATRLLFYDTVHSRQVDIFLGEFSMCHRLELEPRLATLPPHLPPSDLLLLKLQIVQLNAKDVIDAVALVLQHDLGDVDSQETMDAGYIERICGGNWGWYTTVVDNAERIATLASGILASSSDSALVERRFQQLIGRLETAPKSVRWRARARVGRRMRWYEIPDEVG